MAGRLKPPIWFWLVTIVILAWGAMGIFAFYADRTMDAAAVARAREQVVGYLKEHGTILMKDARDLTGSSRKYILPLMEF